MHLTHAPKSLAVNELQTQTFLGIIDSKKLFSDFVEIAIYLYS